MREMKDSGIAFLKQIPANWELLRIKDLGTSRNGLTYSPLDVCDETEGTLVLRSSNVQNGKIVLTDNVYVNCEIRQDLMVRDGDILICSRNGSRDLIGKNAIIDSETRASFGAFMMIYRCVAPHFMYYFLNSPVFSYYLGSFFTTTINQLTAANFGNIKIAFCPDKQERNRIATFLDAKCAEIDALTADIQTQIDTLEQYKRSVITETVTKGLNPDAEMKDSGVQWIGDIPKEWEVSKLKYIGNSKSEAKPYKKGDIFIGLEDIDSFNGNVISQNLDYEECFTSIFKSGDFLFSKLRPYLAKGFLAEYDGFSSGELIRIQFNNKQYSKYYKYQLLSNKFIDLIDSMTYGVKMPRTSWQEIKEQVLVKPPLVDQKQVVEYLDSKTKTIDDTIAAKKKQLEILDDYKKSLIFEYVTGKKEAPAL